MSKPIGILYIVATPIGNVADISQRALETLRSVDLIAAEDTRHTINLLKTYNIVTPLTPYHDHNEVQEAPHLAAIIANGAKVALVSDAGTPLINDPGFRLVQEVKKLGVQVVPIPGACALICALSASALPSNRFLFLGFPPRTKSQRVQLFNSIKTEPGVLIFYESGQRLFDTLKTLSAILGANRRAVLARELTKVYETFIDSTLGTLMSTLETDAMQIKGEHVLLVEGATEQVLPHTENAVSVLQTLLEELPVKQAVKLAAKLTEISRNELYRLALEISQSPNVSA
jgi:16S rRNA (cytidine1402-2'-O)-methyltransferase